MSSADTQKIQLLPLYDKTRVFHAIRWLI